MSLIKNVHFKLMALMFKVRDFFNPPIKEIQEANISPGDHVLDYGCGPGSYTLIAAQKVKDSGKVYAVDTNLLAIKTVEKKAAKAGVSIETILTHCDTGLPDNSIDVILLYDTYHVLDNPQEVLKELCRVLAFDGILSFSDHHMEEDTIYNEIKEFFTFVKKGKRTYTFKMKTEKN